MTRSPSGQASIEYVGVLALLVLVFGVAGAAIAKPDLPGAVVHQAKMALCVVGGDVCRSEEARAAGLTPCVVGSERRSHQSGVTVTLVHIGGGGTMLVERRSDGSALVSKLSGGSIEGTAGFDVKLGPVLQAGGSVSGGVGFRTGRAWEARDETELKTLLADLGDTEPTYRYLEGGRQTAAEVGARLGPKKGKLDLSLVEGSVREAIGRRVGPDGTTLYFGFDGGASGAVADLVGLPSGGRWVAEWHVADPPDLTLRRESPGPKAGQVTETVVRLVLSDPEDLDTAKRLVLWHAAGPAAVVLGRRLQRRLAQHGTIETATYGEKTTGHDVGGELKVIGGLGADHSDSVTTRKLVDAYVVRPTFARRKDCLGV